MEDQILDFFKTFCNAERICIAALLLDKSCTVEEIANHCQIRPVEIPRQLAQMERLGLLVKNGPRYQIDRKTLEALSRSMLGGRKPVVQVQSNDENADAFDRTVIKNFSLPDGRLKEIPLQEKKLVAILKHILRVFEPGVRYNEKQVNESLKRFHPDSATLRRALVDRQMIIREPNGSAYWLPNQEP